VYSTKVSPLLFGGGSQRLRWHILAWQKDRLAPELQDSWASDRGQFLSQLGAELLACRRATQPLHEFTLPSDHPDVAQWLLSLHTPLPDGAGDSKWRSEHARAAAAAGLDWATEECRSPNHAIWKQFEPRTLASLTERERDLLALHLVGTLGCRQLQQQQAAWHRTRTDVFIDLVHSATDSDDRPACLHGRAGSSIQASFVRRFSGAASRDCASFLAGLTGSGRPCRRCAKRAEAERSQCRPDSGCIFLPRSKVLSLRQGRLLTPSEVARFQGWDWSHAASHGAPVLLPWRTGPTATGSQKRAFGASAGSSTDTRGECGQSHSSEAMQMSWRQAMDLLGNSFNAYTCGMVVLVGLVHLRC
jgi:hypothetical protein